MECVKIPIVRYYEHCLSVARNNGFMWIVSLLAHGTGTKELCEHLRANWHAIGDITGKEILFLVAGDEHTHKDSVIAVERINQGLYNDYIYFLNDGQYKLMNSIVYDRQEDIKMDMERGE